MPWAFDGNAQRQGYLRSLYMALGIGVSGLSKYKGNEDTFGIIGLASVGPIIALSLYGILVNARYNACFPRASLYAGEVISPTES